MTLEEQKNISPWRKILRTNFVNIEKLVEFLNLKENFKPQISKKPRFPLNLPLRLAEKIKKNDLNDPILKQFLPTLAEDDMTEGFLTDPVGDANCRALPKLLHKYEGRVLLVTTGACAMHCRYCFRQNFEYDRAYGFLFSEELKSITADETIQEVILSGGDPLSLSNEILEPLIKSLGSISHVKRLRFHTRFPIGIPERIDEGFIQLLKNSRLQTFFVLHINHPNELDETIFSHIKLLQQAGCLVLNQSVLLSGVNDDVETLVKLSLDLVDHGIIPYYLHQLDKVQGSAHFEVEEKKGLYLIEEMSKQLPGYAVPKYVREIPGQPGKTPIY